MLSYLTSLSQSGSLGTNIPSFSAPLPVPDSAPSIQGVAGGDSDPKPHIMGGPTRSSSVGAGVVTSSAASVPFLLPNVSIPSFTQNRLSQDSTAVRGAVTQPLGHSPFPLASLGSYQLWFAWWGWGGGYLLRLPAFLLLPFRFLFLARAPLLFLLLPLLFLLFLPLLFLLFLFLLLLLNFLLLPFLALFLFPLLSLFPCFSVFFLFFLFCSFCFCLFAWCSSLFTFFPWSLFSVLFLFPFVSSSFFASCFFFFLAFWCSSSFCSSFLLFFCRSLSWICFLFCFLPFCFSSSSGFFFHLFCSPHFLFFLFLGIFVSAGGISCVYFGPFS